MENQEKMMKIFVDERHKSAQTREKSSHFAGATKKNYPNNAKNVLP